MTEPSEASTQAGTACAADTIASTSTPASRREATTLHPGAIVGRYRVIELVGRGAMGLVYAAIDPQLERKVALKLIRFPQHDDGRESEAEQRLRREAQALAQLSHPNVVTILDVGRLSGQLFIAMELVEGRTLTRWLREAPRRWREVLDVFDPAGRGLAAAHAANLVHRDFKPDNVLVGDDGRVRVMDFGLARLHDPPSLSTAGHDSVEHEGLSTMLTRAGAQPGTPAYMAPEQHMRGVVDARSDQFSFCVALYEGLYGARPFAGDSLAALATAVCEDTVPPPPAGSRVPAWVHAVLVRGLAKDPAARFSSMDALLHALAHDPTHRRRALWLGAAIGLGGVATAAGVVLHARNLEAGCERAGAAIREVWSAEAAAAVEGSLLATGWEGASDAWARTEPLLAAYADAWQAMRTDACRRGRVTGEWPAERLARAEECLDERRSQLEVQLEVLSSADRDAMFRAVDAAASLPELAPCESVTALARRSPLPDDPTARAQLQEHRRALHRANALYMAGRYADAEELAAQVHEEARAAGNEPLALEALVRLATLEHVRGEHALAREHVEAAYFGAERLELDELAAHAATLMVGFQGRQARYDEALQWSRHAEGALARLGGADDLAMAALLAARADIHDQRAAYDEALADHARALGIRRAVLGDDHLLVADSLLGLSHVHFGKQQLTEAFSGLEDVLATRERILGPRHPLVAEVLNNLGVARTQEGELELARTYLERSLAIRREALGEEHTAVASTLSSLGRLAFERKDYEENVALERRAAGIRERLLGPDHPFVAHSYNNMGAAFRALGRHDEAATALTRAAEAAERTLGPTHPSTLTVRWGLGKARIAQGRHDEGRRILDDVRRALRESEAAPGQLASYEADYALTVWSLPGVAQEELLSMARAARDTLRGGGSSFAGDLGRLEAWLAEHDR